MRTVGDEVFILDRKTSMLHTFSGSGAFIWQKLTEGHSLETIIEAICAEFDVAAETAKNDLSEFISSLSAAGLVTPAQ